MRNLIAALAVGSSILWGAQPAFGQQEESLATVELQNNFEDRVEVFVENGRFDRRLGEVAPLSTAEFSLPDWIVRRDESVELFVARDGTDLESQSFEVQPGDNFGMIVPPVEPSTTKMVTLPEEKLSEATLTVENERAQELVIYAEENDIFQVRLGEVAPNSTETLEFPESVVTTNDMITVLVDPRGAWEMETHPLRLEQGRHIGLRVVEP